MSWAATAVWSLLLCGQGARVQAEGAMPARRILDFGAGSVAAYLVDFSNVPLENATGDSVNGVGAVKVGESAMFWSSENLPGPQPGPQETVLQALHSRAPSELRELDATFAARFPILEPHALPTVNITVTTYFLGTSALNTNASPAASGPALPPATQLPSIFDPRRAGYTFRLSDALKYPGTQLRFEYMTLWMHDVAFQDIATSTFKRYFQFGRFSRVCFMNSELVLKSCDGFDHANPPGLFCCTLSTCFSEEVQVVSDLSNSYIHLSPLTCVSLGGDDGAPPFGGVGRMSRRTLGAIVAPSVALVVILCSLVGFALVRRRRRRHAESPGAALPRVDTGPAAKGRAAMYDAQESQDHRVRYRLDLLSKAANALEEPLIDVPRGAALKVLDAGPGQNATSVQQQLQSVLQEADDEAPVSVSAEIGRGAFGVVYRGTWKNIQVAIKTVLFQASGATADVRADPVMREALLALRMNHPNLVATYRANVRLLQDAGARLPGGEPGLQFAAGAEEGAAPWRFPESYQLFLLQEYCDGGTLYEWLSRERLHPGNVADQATIVRCALDITRGIQALHETGIVHGDLKPQNIMLASLSEAARAADPDPRPPAFAYATKLADFGLSFQIADDKDAHLSNMRIGTPFYLAPEVQGRGYLSKAADVYSLGVLLWEMFHGMPPYAAAAGELVANADFPCFSLRGGSGAAPLSYAAATLACLSGDHEQRPAISDVVAVLDDLNQFVNGGCHGSLEAGAHVRHAPLSRLAQGPLLDGLAVPKSLAEEASQCCPGQPRPPSANGAAAPGALLHMLEQCELQRNGALQRRLEVARARRGRLRQLAGLEAAVTASVREGHGGQRRWRCDALSPAGTAKR